MRTHADLQSLRRSNAGPSGRAGRSAASGAADALALSPRMLAQRRAIQSAFGPAVIQRVITTAGGVWDTTQYEAWGPKRPDPMSDVGFGAEISLQFMPGKGAPFGDKIGLVQTVTALAGGKPDPTGFEAVPLNKEGRAIDRDRGEHGQRNTNPVYGAHNTAHSSASKLTENVPKQGLNTYGKRNRFSKNSPAKLWDMPSSALGRGEIGKSFETSAVVLEGAHAGTYLGSVGWGYKRPADAKQPVLEPTALTKLSDGNPTPEFVEAARQWNEQGKTDEGDALVPVPIPT